MSDDSLLATPTQEELAYVDQEIGPAKDVRSYLMLDLVIKIFRERSSFATLKECILASAENVSVVYTAAFSACWRHRLRSIKCAALKGR